MENKWTFIEVVFFITAFRLVAPTCLIYLIVSWLYGRLLVSRFLGPYAIAELAFFFFVYLPRRARMQQPAIHPTALSPSERMVLFRKCANHIATEDNYPSGWFFSPDIKRENARDWILWALFSSDSVDQAWEEEINTYLAIVEKMLGRKLEHGNNKDAASMRLTLDPVFMVHRPLMWYAIVFGADVWSSISLSTLGFRHYSTAKWFQVFPPRPHTLFSRPSAAPDLPYWYRPHRTKTKLPVVFFHGIGVGLWLYIPFIRDLVALDPEIGILAIELMPISMRITSPLLPRSKNCLNISRILNSLQISKFVLVSHSYGTITAAHMLKSPSLSTRIAASVLIDPIPFLLHLPNVAFNFVYRQPRYANEWIIWFYASRDPDISRALSRHFFWAENVMWKEDLEGEGRKMAAVLGGADQIIHAQEVRKYLTGEEEAKMYWKRDDVGLEVLFFSGLSHGEVLDTKERRKIILEIIGRFVNESHM